MYKINTFLLSKTENGLIAQTRKNINVIQNPKLIEFLIFIEQNKFETIEEEYIESYFNDKELAYKVADFLLKINIFEKDVNKILKIKSICLISNDETFKECFKFNFSSSLEKIGFLDIEKVLELRKANEINNYDAVYVFLNPFNLNIYMNLIDILMREDIIIKTIFYYNNGIYVSNFYKGAWRNPCPKCFFYEIESHLRGTIQQEGYNFQTIIDMIYKEKVNFNVYHKLSFDDFIPLNFILFSELSTIKMDDPNKINLLIDKTYFYKLCDFKLEEDYSYFWELCDCND